MRMNKHSIRNSIYAILSGSLPSTVAAEQEERMEAIRETMLQQLLETERDYPQVTRRVRHATDTQALWYLRGEAMMALSALHGELEARHRMADITKLFQGLLPRSLKPRVNSLARRSTRSVPPYEDTEAH